MSKDVLRQCRDALETARNGLVWYRDRYPDAVDGSDDEASTEITEALAAADAALSAAPVDERAAFEALRELVAVKDIKDRAEALHFAGPLSDAGEGWKAEYDALRADYIRRQPLAWEAARASLAAPAPAETVTLVGVKNGIETVLGEVPMPPKMKARELVREMFGAWEPDDGSDPYLAMAVCEQLIEWMGKQAAPAPAQAVPLTHMQIVLLWGHRSDGPSNSEIVSFARAIERAHGITGEQK